jgi:hypothetical protein
MDSISVYGLGLPGERYIECLTLGYKMERFHTVNGTHSVKNHKYLTWRYLFGPKGACLL